LPLPADEKDCVVAIAKQQKMPPSLTFADRFGTCIPDALVDVDQHSLASEDDSTFLDDPDHDSDDNDDDPDDYSSHTSDVPAPLFQDRNTGVDHTHQNQPSAINHDQADDLDDDDDDDDNIDHDQANNLDDDNDNNIETEAPEANVPEVTDNEDMENDEITGVNTDDDRSTNMDSLYGPREHNINLRPRKP
jgi:hypothetical protein